MTSSSVLKFMFLTLSGTDYFTYIMVLQQCITILESPADRHLTISMTDSKAMCDSFSVSRQSGNIY